MMMNSDLSVMLLQINPRLNLLRKKNSQRRGGSPKPLEEISSMYPTSYESQERSAPSLCGANDGCASIRTKEPERETKERGAKESEKCHIRNEEGIFDEGQAQQEGGTKECEE